MILDRRQIQIRVNPKTIPSLRGVDLDNLQTELWPILKEELAALQANIERRMNNNVKVTWD